MKTITGGQNDVETVVDRCVGLLVDDHARQGGYLSYDDVIRVLLRRKLAPEQCIIVWERLTAAGVKISELAVEHPTETKRRKEHRTDEVHASDKERRGSGLSELDYPSHPLLDHEREIQLARRHQAAKNLGHRPEGAIDDEKQILESGLKAKEELILSNIRLVFSCAKGFTASTSLSFEDVVQEGILGLFKAVDRYDPELGYRFSTYASWWIDQSIRRAIIDGGHTVRIPAGISERIRKLKRKRRRLSQQLGRVPTNNELAHEMAWGVEDINFLLQIQQDAQSIEDALADTDESSRGGLLRSRTESPTQHVEREELKSLIEQILSSLDARARRILVYRFGLLGNKPRTLEQIGRRMGITRERVRQIEKKALNRMAESWRRKILMPYAE